MKSFTNCKYIKSLGHSQPDRPVNICMNMVKVLNSFKSFAFSCSLSTTLIVGRRAGPNTIVDDSVKVIFDGVGTVTVDVDVWVVDTVVSCIGVVRVAETDVSTET